MREIYRRIRLLILIIKGQVTNFKYDDFGNLIEIESPDSGVTLKAYDKAGNLVEETDGEGKTSIRTYDALNRITSIQYSNSIYNVYFYYDEPSSSYGVGRLTSVQDSSGTKRLNYFRTGFIKDEVVSTGGNYYTTTYTYNKNGNIKSIVYPSGRQVWYNLNVKNGKPLSINAIINGESREIITGAEYLPFGSIKSLNFSNGLNLQRSYDLKYRLTSNTNGQINTDYVYDNEYNILSISGSYSRTYGYLCMGNSG